MIQMRVKLNLCPVNIIHAEVEMGPHTNITTLFLRLALTVGLVATLTARPSSAGFISTFEQTGSISSWGTNRTPTYGQTFTATSTFSTLTAMTFSVSGGTPQSYAAHVFAWNPLTFTATGTALFSSPFQTIPNAATNTFDKYTVNTGTLSLTPGQQYVAMFSTIGVPLDFPSPTARAWGRVSDGTYTGGTFVFNNLSSSDINDLAGNTRWNFNSASPANFGDLAFRLDFQDTASLATPVPPTFVMMLVGAVGYGLVRRKRMA
jgi:hypothetical protein